MAGEQPPFDLTATQPHGLGINLIIDDGWRKKRNMMPLKVILPYHLQ